MPKLLNIEGERYGRLLVIKVSKKVKSRAYWECVCDCGNVHITSQECLRTGKTKSCGCLRKQSPPNKKVNREDAVYKRLYLSTIVKRAKRKGYSTDISYEDFIVLSKSACNYCGLKNSCFSSDRFGSKGLKTSELIIKYNGIDRINSDLGYFKDNVVPCCKRCNTAKNIMTQEDFKEWVNAVFNHYCK